MFKESVFIDAQAEDADRSTEETWIPSHTFQPRNTYVEGRCFQTYTRQVTSSLERNGKDSHLPSIVVYYPIRYAHLDDVSSLKWQELTST
jgi:hypothetical protein